MKKYWKYIFVFIFFLSIFYLSPIAGDDWSNYLVGSMGIRHALGVSLGMYFDWEGRLASRIFINILTYHKWLWNIINALLVTIFIYGSIKLIDSKKNYIFPLVVLLILGMNPYMFSQVMVWLAGNMTYFFIVPILILYFYYIIKNDKYNKWFAVIFSLLNLVGVMFVENMALVFVFGNILVIIYKFIKTKKIDKNIIIYLIISIIGTISMLLSPGTRFRNSIENVSFNELSLFGKIFYNIPNFIFYTFISNPYLLILLSLGNYFMIRKNTKNKWLKYLLIIYVLIGGLITLMVYPLSLFKTSFLEIFIDSHNIFVILYWIVYLLISFYYIYLEDKKDLKIILLLLIGLVSNIVMLISPTWGFRTAFFTYIMFGISYIIILSKYLKNESRIIFSSKILVIFLFLFYFIFYINISLCQKQIEKDIIKQVKNNEQIIYIDSFPEYVNCDINPRDSYHLDKFKEYYSIKKDCEIALQDGKWKYIIFYSK